MGAIDPQIQGPDRVREVFARVAAGDSGVADLYAEDRSVHVAGHVITGRDAIRDFYQHTIDTMHPKPEVQDVLESGSRYVAVVHVPSDRGVQDAIDLFELDLEGIRRLTIFSRG